MKYFLFIILILLNLNCIKNIDEKEESYHEISIEKDTIQSGDIIFHTSLSSQSMAIQLATDSPYSHVGIVMIDNNEKYVLEAIQPVQYTPIEEWIKRGEKGHYVIKRLKNSSSVITENSIANLKSNATQYLGKNYDLKFEWSDDKIYCSELVWKLYKESFGIELCSLKTIKDYDLQNKQVQSKMKERYGNEIPLNEIVVSPQDIFESSLLK